MGCASVKSSDVAIAGVPRAKRQQQLFPNGLTRGRQMIGLRALVARQGMYAKVE